MSVERNDERTEIVDLDAFLRQLKVRKRDRDIIAEHVYQAFVAGFCLEHGAAFKSMSHYPFNMHERHQAPELLREAFDVWEARRR